MGKSKLTPLKQTKICSIYEQRTSDKMKNIATFQPQRDTAKLLLKAPTLHRYVACHIPVEKALIAKEDSYDSGLDSDAENIDCHTDF